MKSLIPLAPEGPVFLDVMEVQEDKGSPLAAPPAAVGWVV